jgi:uncharacterized membrane protein (DUF441 family)
MEEPTYILLAVLAVAVLGKANGVAVAAGILLIIKLLQGDRQLFPIIERNGMFWGLVILIAAILIPLASGKISGPDLLKAITSWRGIVAMALSFLTTYLSGLGLQYLTVQGHAEIMPALILGAVAAATFLGGVPVGPLITSGLLALLIKWLPQK